MQAEGMEVRQAGNRPLHLLSLFSEKNSQKIFLKNKNKHYRNYKLGDLPNSENFYNSTLSLPTFTFENKKLIKQYILAFKKVCYYLNSKLNESKSS